ncbi:MAG: nuclear transport factor 2 family protein [Pyrinomonadaceae bacterium]
MMNIKPILLMAAATLAFGACQPAANTTVSNSNMSASANMNANAAKTTAAAPTQDALFAVEKQGWEAWKNHTPETFGEILSDKYVGFAKTGRQDKAAAVKSMTDAKCDIKSYSWSDQQMRMLGSDVAVLTFKAAQDGTCDGKQVPAEVWASSVYLRDGDKWKNVLYAENPVTDPNASPAKAAAGSPADKTEESKPTDAAKPDSLTDSLIAVETQAWDAWKKRDAKAVDSMMTNDFMYVSGTGRKDKAASIKAWSEPKCEGLDYTFSDPKGVSLGKDVALVTYKADVKGTCDGKPNQPHLWVASFDMKECDNWKNPFYTDLNR